MNKNLFYLMLMLCGNLMFSQQNEDFLNTKKYFDYQRFMLNGEFQKKFDVEKNVQEKISIKKDFSEFMIKLDSIQNTAFIRTLINVKNKEDLEKVSAKESRSLQPTQKNNLSAEAAYPGGIETLRKQVADLFYAGAFLPQQGTLKTSVEFTVEKDGSIRYVHADGDSFAFNRQAEIAIYLLPEKFSPAAINGNAVRYRFRLPLAMNFD